MGSGRPSEVSTARPSKWGSGEWGSSKATEGVRASLIAAASGRPAAHPRAERRRASVGRARTVRQLRVGADAVLAQRGAAPPPPISGPTGRAAIVGGHRPRPRDPRLATRRRRRAHRRSYRPARRGSLARPSESGSLRRSSERRASAGRRRRPRASGESSNGGSSTKQATAGPLSTKRPRRPHEQNHGGRERWVAGGRKHMLARRWKQAGGNGELRSSWWHPHGSTIS